MVKVFIKAHLSFSLNGHTLEFVHQHISSTGASGLAWGPLSPAEHFGKEIEVLVRTATPEPIAMRVKATITRELTLNASNMSLRFHADSPGLDRIREQVQTHGILPTEYVRKYPRLPATQSIQTFPLLANVSLINSEAGASAPPISFHVSNLSPNGIMLSTENQRALAYNPGDRIEIVLEPRGWFPVHVQMHGLICRITDEPHLQSKNLTRHLGIKFTAMSEPNKNAFMDLLKDILNRYKQEIG